MKKFLSALPLFAALLLAGCASTGKTSPAPDGELAGTYWRPANDRFFAYMEFTGDGRVVGAAGRNRFFGPVAYAKGKRLRLGPMAAARQPGPQLEYEESFLARLEETRGYVLDGDTLTLYSEERRPVMRLKKLTPQPKKP